MAVCVKAEFINFYFENNGRKFIITQLTRKVEKKESADLKARKFFLQFLDVNFIFLG
jgi:hypothetical protein